MELFELRDFYGASVVGLYAVWGSEGGLVSVWDLTTCARSVHGTAQWTSLVHSEEYMEYN